MNRLIDPDALRCFGTALLSYADVPPVDARLLADTRVTAQQWRHVCLRRPREPGQ